jgi:hypothetical protein
MFKEILASIKSVIKPKPSAPPKPLKSYTTEEIKAIEVKLLKQIHPGMNSAQATRLSTRLGKKRRYK